MNRCRLAMEALIRRRTLLRIALAIAVGLTAWVVVVYAVPAAQLGRTWNEIERVSFDGGAPGKASDAEDSVAASSTRASVVDPVPTGPGITDPSAPASTGSSRAGDEPPTASPEGPPDSEGPGSTKVAANQHGAKASGKGVDRAQTAPSSSTLRITSTLPDDQVPDAVLLVGSDSRSNLENASHFGSFEGQRADVVVLALFDGPDIALVSLPRDLAVADTCRGGTHKLGEAYAGCGDTPGLVQLVSEVGSVTGIHIDHAAAIGMGGFEKAVDAVGGYEICPDHALRDEESGLDVEAGCQLVDGETTLAWIRSRHTERRVDGHWEPYPAVSDLVRNERERQFLTDMLHRVGVDLSVNEMLSLGSEVGPYLTIDDQLSIREVVRLGWQFRNAQVSTVELPVVDDRLSDGSAVLRATEDPASVIDDALND